MHYKNLAIIFSMTLLVFGVLGLNFVRAISTPDKTQNISVLPSVVTFGAFIPFTGELGSLAEGIMDGARAAAFEINASSDFSFDIRFDEFDTALTLQVALDAYAVYKAKVVAGIAAPIIIGAAASLISSALADLAKDDDIVQISYASTAASLSSTDLTHFWRVVPTDALQSQALAALAKDTTDTIVIINRADDYGNGFADNLKTNFEAIGGTVADTLSYPSETTDFAALVSTVKTATAAEAVVMISFITDDLNLFPI